MTRKQVKLLRVAVHDVSEIPYGQWNIHPMMMLFSIQFIHSFFIILTSVLNDIY